jgi:Skp family chaperone for outer membrane proteins
MVVLFLAHEFSAAGSSVSAPASNIGIVNIDKALQNCQATQKFKERMNAEGKKMEAEEQKLKEEIKSLRGMVQALTITSNDYYVQSKDLMLKQKELEGLQDYMNQVRGLKTFQWTEKVYPEILRITKELGAKKGLALVLGVQEPQFPSVRPEALSATIQTHKVLYNGGCSDLTSEVIAELDKLDFLLKE